jgi:hypothetical protein
MINTEQRGDSLSSQEVRRDTTAETYTRLAQASQDLEAILAHASEEEIARIESVVTALWEKVTARRRREAFEYGLD